MLWPGITETWFLHFSKPPPTSLHHRVSWLSWASGNSHLFVGPPNHPVDHEMSSFHHSEMQMTSATIISHPVIISYAFWKGRKCVLSVTSSYCLSLERTTTSNIKAWKGSGASTHIVLSSFSLALQGFSFHYQTSCVMATLHLFPLFPIFQMSFFLLCHFICRKKTPQ